MPRSLMTDVFVAITNERAYQDKKWGTINQHPHEVPGWLLIMERELQEAKDAWTTQRGDRAALMEILQVAAVAVACLEQHGVISRTPARPPVAPVSSPGGVQSVPGAIDLALPQAGASYRSAMAATRARLRAQASQACQTPRCDAHPGSLHMVKTDTATLGPCLEQGCGCAAFTPPQAE